MDVVGVGAEGWTGMPAGARRLVESAQVLVGSPRLLALVPDGPQERVTLPKPLRPGLRDLIDGHAERRLVVLASGDPLHSGIAATLIDLVGAEAVNVHPAVSSAAIMRARLRWPAESADTIRISNGTEARVLRHAYPGGRVIALSADEHTPSAIAALLVRSGLGDTHISVGNRLGAPDESIRSATASTWRGHADRLNIVALEYGTSAGGFGLLGGLPDDAFEHDGQLTKQAVRAAALAHLAPQPGLLLWDIGAGAGSIGIEWMRAHPGCRAIAVESNPTRARRITRNAHRLGVPDLEVVVGAAPSALEDLPTPDAIFIGGGVTAPRQLDRCWRALRPGGRLVAHAVTLESERLVVDGYRDLGGSLTRISVETADSVGTFTGWRPARAIVQWSVIR